MNLKSYNEIKEKIGWYELKVSPKEITFINDSRFETEFPTELPGGYLINYICDYSISDSTLILYEKKNKKSKIPELVSKEGRKIILTLTKNENNYFGTSFEISDTENLINSGRNKVAKPYVFYRFSDE